MDKLTIGKMAKLQGISKKTLRKYHSIGLFIPAVVDENTGYRYYSLMQSVQLDMIQCLKEIGFTLIEIKELLNCGDEGVINDIFEEHIGKLEEKQRRLRIAQQSLSNMKNRSSIFNREYSGGEIFIEQHSERKHLSFELEDEAYSLTNIGRDVDANLYMWELCLRKLKSEFTKYNIPMLLFQNAGCKIRQKDLLARNLFVSEAFVFLDEANCELYPQEKITAAPKGFYLCMYCDGVMFDDGTYKELIYIERMLDAIDKNNYTITGDYFGEVLTESRSLFPAERDMYMKLQIPIAINESGNARQII